MSLTVEEAFGLGAKGFEVAKSVKDAVDKLPPKADRKAVDYARALGFADDTPGMLTAELIDLADQEIKD